MDSNNLFRKSFMCFYNKFNVYLGLMKDVNLSLMLTWTTGFRLFFFAISGVPFTSSFPCFEEGVKLLFVLDYLLEKLFAFIEITYFCLPNLICQSCHFFHSLLQWPNLLPQRLEFEDSKFTSWYHLYYCAKQWCYDYHLKSSSRHWKQTDKMWVYENKPCQVFVLCKSQI